MQSRINRLITHWWQEVAVRFQIKSAQGLDCSKCNLPHTIPHKGKAICSGWGLPWL